LLLLLLLLDRRDSQQTFLGFLVGTIKKSLNMNFPLCKPIHEMKWVGWLLGWLVCLFVSQ
jgi:hypothetical protein